MENILENKKVVWVILFLLFVSIVGVIVLAILYRKEQNKSKQLKENITTFLSLDGVTPNGTKKLFSGPFKYQTDGNFFLSPEGGFQLVTRCGNNGPPVCSLNETPHIENNQVKCNNGTPSCVIPNVQKPFIRQCPTGTYGSKCELKMCPNGGDSVF
jgi:hypothetical protein